MQMMRSMRSMHHRDSSVTEREIPPGTWRRVFRFAAPYRTELAVFLALIIADALIGVATPILAGRVVNEITRHGHVRVIVQIAFVIAGLAVVDAGLSFAQRWYSARIGEASSTTCALRCSTTCSACRSRSSPGRRPVPWSAG